MHTAAHEYVARQVDRLGPFRHGVEIGSRNINGEVRDLFDEPASYTGLDLAPGPGVDWVGDAIDFEPYAVPDAVVCCEVFEHTATWPLLVTAAFRWLGRGGVLLVTCAGPGRRPHSAIDGGWELHPGEHYRNVSATTLAGVMRAAGFRDVEAGHHLRDTRALGFRP